MYKEPHGEDARVLGRSCVWRCRSPLWGVLRRERTGTQFRKRSSLSRKRLPRCAARSATKPAATLALRERRSVVSRRLCLRWLNRSRRRSSGCPGRSSSCGYPAQGQSFGRSWRARNALLPLGISFHSLAVRKPHWPVRCLTSGVLVGQPSPFARNQATKASTARIPTAYSSLIAFVARRALGSDGGRGTLMARTEHSSPKVPMDTRSQS
jgi:hypothetical protein